MSNFKTIRLQVGQLQSNCYLYVTGDNNLFVIDPGDDDQYIIEKIEALELKPTAILATHGHFDHVLAGFSLQATYNAPFFIHNKDDFLLSRMRETAIHFGEVDPGPPPITTDVSHFNLLEVLSTPGHTPGSVSYYDKNGGIVFVGDLLFADGSIGEVTHTYSDRADAKKSIQKILSLPLETVVYSGHGEESRVEILREKFNWALL